ncbi:hypothetical protein scyTo_0024624, partial [Scyliorhinus torazame]|nr:hypothetical protein [Scyliorhinus torazame]
MLLLGLAVLWLSAGCAWQEPAPAHTICSPEACYTAHLRRRSFNEAWRACRERGGNLASIKRQREAELVEELMQGLSLSEEQGELKLWLGLQRQPRQCSPYKSLRGFTWTTGDQGTWYTNWLKEEYPGSCAATRCVVLSFGAGEAARHANYKWLDGSCQLAVDGYLCRFSYRGMCEPIELGARGPVVYDTPFGVTSSRLRHIPFGSVATLPCGGPRGAQSLLCMAREEEERRGGGGGGGGGGVGWSRDPPYCQEARPRSGCAADNGGCGQTCVDEGAYYHCQCDEGYQLDADGRSCSPLDGCAGGPCQFYCLSGPGGFACSCPEGYRLAKDGRSCLDVDECVSAPCGQDCANTLGSYLCRCHEGYQLEEGECRDVDECVGMPCGQLCANTEGSFQCYCEVGFTLSEEDAATCSDVDECHYQGSCQQMCVNYLGHYECHCEEGYALDPD